MPRLITPANHRPQSACTAVLLIAFACGLASAAQALAAGDRAASALEGGVDASIQPGDDFFSYANGAWLKATEIPDGKGLWGARSEIAQRTRQQVAELLDDASAAPCGVGCAQGGRLSRRLSERGRDRGPRHRAAEAAAGSHRSHSRQGGLDAPAGQRAACRCRPHEPGRLQLVAHPGAGGASWQPWRDAPCRLPAARWFGAAGPRALPRRRCAHAGAARPVPGGDRPHAGAAWRPGRRPCSDGGGQPSWRRAGTGDRHRAQPCHCRGIGRRQQRRHAVDARGFRSRGAGHGLDCVLRGRGLGQAADLRRLAADRVERRGSTGGVAAAAGVEGLSARARDRSLRRRVAASAFRRGRVVARRHRESGAARHACAARLGGDPVRHERVSGQDVRRSPLPARAQGAGARHRRQRRCGLHATSRSGGVDVARHAGDGAGQVEKPLLRRRLPRTMAGPLKAG